MDNEKGKNKKEPPKEKTKSKFVERFCRRSHRKKDLSFTCSGDEHKWGIDDDDGELCRVEVEAEIEGIFKEIAIDERKGKLDFAYTCKWWGSGLRQNKQSGRNDAANATDGSTQPQGAKRRYLDPSLPWVVSPMKGWYKIYNIEYDAFLEHVVGPWDMTSAPGKVRTAFGRRLANLAAVLVRRDFSDICSLSHRVVFNPSTTFPKKSGPKSPFLRVFVDCRISCCSARYVAVIRRKPLDTDKAVQMHIYADPSRSLTILPVALTAANESRFKMGKRCTQCFVDDHVRVVDEQFKEAYVAPFIPASLTNEIKLGVRRDSGLRGPVKLKNEDIIYGLFRRTFGANHRSTLALDDQIVRDYKNFYAQVHFTQYLQRVFDMLGFGDVRFEICRSWMETYILTCKSAGRLSAGHARQVKLLSAGIISLLPENKRMYIASNIEFWRNVYGNKDVHINPDFDDQNADGFMQMLLEEVPIGLGEATVTQGDSNDGDSKKQGEQLSEALSQLGIHTQPDRTCAIIDQIKKEYESDDETNIGSFELANAEDMEEEEPEQRPQIVSRYRLRPNIIGKIKRYRGVNITARRDEPLAQSSAPMKNRGHKHSKQSVNKNLRQSKTVPAGRQTRVESGSAFSSNQIKKPSNSVSRKRSMAENPQIGSPSLEQNGASPKAKKPTVCAPAEPQLTPLASRTSPRSTKNTERTPEQITIGDVGVVEPAFGHNQLLYLGDKRIPGSFRACRSQSDLYGVDAKNMYIPLLACLRQRLQPEVKISTILMKDVSGRGRRGSSISSAIRTVTVDDDGRDPTADIQTLIGSCGLRENFSRSILATSQTGVYVSLDSLRSM